MAEVPLRVVSRMGELRWRAPHISARLSLGTERRVRDKLVPEVPDWTDYVGARPRWRPGFSGRVGLPQPSGSRNGVGGVTGEGQAFAQAVVGTGVAGPPSTVVGAPSPGGIGVGTGVVGAPALGGIGVGTGVVGPPSPGGIGVGTGVVGPPSPGVIPEPAPARTLQVYPVYFTLAADGSGVLGQVSSRLQGPLRIEWARGYSDVAATSVATWALWRLDISDHPGLQTFTLNGAGIPTGGVKDRMTLWPYSVIFDEAIPQTDRDSGWIRSLHGSVTSGELHNSPCGVYVPWSDVYFKLYFQNDEVSDRRVSFEFTTRFFAQ